MVARRLWVLIGGLGALLALATFRIVTPTPQDESKPTGPPNAYSFDPASGETRASATAEDGVQVRLHSGKQVPLRLPAGFTLIPDAEVLEHHRVERGRGHRTLVLFGADRPVADVVAFYRAQAEAAGIALDIEIVTPDATTLAGRGPDGLDFSFTARREDGRTRAQLAVGHNL